MPLSTEELRARIATQQWTAHNIRLNSECTTIPGEPDFIATDLRLHAILRVLNMLGLPNLRFQAGDVKDFGADSAGKFEAQHDYSSGSYESFHFTYPRCMLAAVKC